MNENDWEILRVSPKLREKYYRVVHASGLTVYVFPKRFSTVYAELAVRFGSADECFRVGEEKEPTRLPGGVAHFLEHKMFENADGSDSLARFSELGADANAYTDYERTVYLFHTASDPVPALEELLRFVTHPHFTEKSVRKEQGIIAEEIRMYRDSPGDRCFSEMLSGLYHKHPVRNDICGSEESIRLITPEILYRAYHAFYRPSNMVLTVCGDVELQKILSVCDKCLPEGDKCETVEKCLPQEPAGVFRSRSEQKMQLGKPLFCLGMKDAVTAASAGFSPRERARRGMSFALLNEILFSRSEDFYNRLFEAGLISPSWSYGYTDSETYAYNGFSGESEQPDAVEEEFLRYLDSVRKNGWSHESFVRNRRVMEAEYIQSFDSAEEIAGQLTDCALDGTELFDYPEILREITEEELFGLLTNAFREEFLTLSVVRPLKATV